MQKQSKRKHTFVKILNKFIIVLQKDDYVGILVLWKNTIKM